MIFCRSVIGIFAAAVGFALSLEEENLFRLQLDSIKTFSKNEKTIEEFTCEYLDGKLKISQSNRSKLYGTKESSKIYEAISYKHAGVAGYLVPTIELLRQDTYYQPITLLQAVKERLTTITAITSTVAEPPTSPFNGSSPILDLVGERSTPHAPDPSTPQAMGTVPAGILDTLVNLLQHRSLTPVVKVVNKTRPLFSLSMEGFQKFKNQLAEFGAYDGCLVELISRGEREALATIWNPFCPAATNLTTIDGLLIGDTDVALNQITQAIFRANDMSGISILRCRVSRDNNGDPEIDEWLSTITNLLSSGVAKDIKAANVAILDGVATDYRAEVNRIKDLRQDAWKYMPTLDLVREIADILRSTKFARIRERANKHFFYTPRNLTASSIPKEEAVTPVESNQNLPVPPLVMKMTEQEAITKKYCKICKSTGSHYFTNCTKYNAEKDRSRSKRSREEDPVPADSSKPTKEIGKKGGKIAEK